LQLAKAIRWVVDEAESYSSVHVPAFEQRAGHAVRENSERFATLAERLEAPPPHRLRGLAMISHLVYDAESPLYDGQPPETLAGAIQRAQAALDE
jgi:hypothetical protein